MAETLKNVEVAALAYLATQLGSRCPHSLKQIGEFDEGSLEDEGRVTLFEFELRPADGTATVCKPDDARHIVAVGKTTPNYSPAYGLAADDYYSLHVGTRFLVETGIERAAVADQPEAVREQMRRFVQGCNPAAVVGADELLLLFRLEDQHFAVYRITINDQPVLCVGGDLPHGFYPPEQYPPQVALRLHLGRAIREEARREREAPRRQGDRP